MLDENGPVVPAVRRVASTRAASARPASFRPAGPEDIAACADIWQESTTDYLRRLNQPVFPGDLEPLRRLLGHILATDPERFWVATLPANRGPADGRPSEDVVGFGAATIRGDAWFLSMLFVLPPNQGAGIGRELLTRTFPADMTAGSAEGAAGIRVLATATDSAQPISNALYSGYGIVPRLPVFHFVGRPAHPDALPALPGGVDAVPFEAIAAGTADGTGHRALVEAVGAIDRQLIGYAHPEDHAFLRRDGRLGYLYRDPDGAPLGYGYTSPVGRIGPVAALDEALLAPFVGHLLAAVEPRGASSLWIPGAADRTFRALLEAGIQIEGFPALLCWNRPFASFERYLPISLAII